MRAYVDSIVTLTFGSHDRSAEAGGRAQCREGGAG